MSSVKDMFMAAQEQLVEEYLEEHPEASEREAYDAVSGEAAMDRMNDNFANMVDAARQRAKDART